MKNDHDPKPLDDILDALKRSGPLSKSFEEARLWERWPEVAGPVLMPHGRPLGIRNGTLTIEIDSAVWMHKFSYHKGDILKGAHAVLGHSDVSDLFFVLAEEEKRGDPQDDV